MGRPYSEFCELSPRILSLLIVGFQKAKQEKEVSKFRLDWERIRWQTYILMLPHQKKNSKLKASDLIEFPWEVESPKKQDQETINSMLSRISKRDNIEYKIKANE